METVDLKKLEDAVLSDLEAIKKSTVRAFDEIYGDYSVPIGASDFTYLFDGVMSLDDFANFVYFSYFSGLYMRNEPKKSINAQLDDFIELISWDDQAKEHPGVSKEFVDEFFNYWLCEGQETVKKNLYNNLGVMVKDKKLPEKDTPGEEMWESIRAVVDYKSDTTVARRQGFPIGKNFFYQAVIQTQLRRQNRDVLVWMASNDRRKGAYTRFYKEFLFFIKIWMLDNHTLEELLADEPSVDTVKQKKEGFLDAVINNSKKYHKGCIKKNKPVDVGPENKKETYISRAIALVELERSYRFLVSLDFALALGKSSDYFNLPPNWRRFWLSNLPPHFFFQIPPRDYSTPAFYYNHPIARMFRLFSQGFDIHTGRKYQVPVQMFGPYSKFFLSAQWTEPLIEEYRYYIIIYLATIIDLNIERLVDIQYSHDKFIWFIYNKYNIFKIYEDKVNMDIGKVITAPVVNNLRKIAKEIVGK